MAKVIDVFANVVDATFTRAGMTREEATNMVKLLPSAEKTIRDILSRAEQNAPKVATVNVALKDELAVLVGKLSTSTMIGSDTDILQHFGAIMLVTSKGTMSAPAKGGASDIPLQKFTTVHYRHTDAYGIKYSDWTMYQKALVSAGLVTYNGGGTMTPTAKAIEVFSLKLSKGQAPVVVKTPKVSSAGEKQRLEAEIATLRAQLASKGK